MENILKVLMESWKILQDSALFMLFGFTMAGLLKGFVPDDWVARHLGRNNSLSVLKASLLGAPLPLCSCGVIPAAAGLYRQGASKGATTAFLISTPETGVDSIAITYGLMDPIMTVIRPLAALLTATAAGLGIHWLDRSRAPGVALSSDCSCTGTGCGCGPLRDKAGLGKKLISGMAYAFGDLLQDIGKWFLLGLLVAGAISAYLPADFISKHMDGGLAPMLIMLAVGIPLYVCASASTPIAAALALKGLSPGAALVFLLAGPATNAATLIVIFRMLGKRAAAIYLATIALVSVLAGLGTDFLYGYWGLGTVKWIQGTHRETLGWLSDISAVVLLFLIARTLLPRSPAKAGASVSSCNCLK